MSRFDRATIAEAGVSMSTTKGRTPIRAFTLRVVIEEGNGAQLQLGARPVVIGADPTCGLVIDDPKVSRRHAEVSATAEGVRVRDLQSRNGTFVENVRVNEAIAAPGSHLRVGHTVVQILGQPPPVIRPSNRHRFGGLVGASAVMREAFAILELAGASDATVLIQGESGTGKELAARAIHDHSARAEQPFVIVDCSAAPEQLLESQLFGHLRGAFTGAANDRKGAFLEADGGTVFLDEIGELTLPAQARLLRVLEARTVQQLGSDRTTPVDVRVVAATHRDIFAMVEAKTFRFDLFHRLAVVHVMLPPLIDRLEDIEPLVKLFYEGRGVDPGVIGGENLDRLKAHRWRGNVRELRNVLERAWVLAGPGGAPFEALTIALDPRFEAEARNPTLEELVDTRIPFKEAKERWNAVLERRYLAEVYERHGGNLTRAAEEAGIQRHHFRELLNTHGLKSK